MFDIRTLSLVTGAVALFLSIPFVVLAVRHKGLFGVIQWAAGLFSAFLGLTMVGLRGVLPGFFTVVVGNTLILGFSLMIVRGMKAFLALPQRTWFDVATLAAAALGLQLFFWPWPDTAARIAVFSVTAVFFTARSALIVWKEFPRILQGRDFVLLATFGVFGAWHTLRAALSLAFVAPAADFLVSGLYQGLTFFVGIGTNIIVCTALLVITIRKLELDLTSARREVQTLTGLLPICAGCKKIRGDDGAWVPVESYISRRSEVNFSHGLCPDCLRKYYPEHIGEG